MNLTEQTIIGAFLMDDRAKTLLPKVKPEWFTDWHRALIKTMQDMYFQNEPIAAHTILRSFRDKAAQLGQCMSAHSTVAYLEHDLLYLEVEYNKKRLLEGVQEVRPEMDLIQLQQHLEAIVQESRISQRNEVSKMSQVIGKKIDELEQRILSGDTMKGLQTGWKSLDKYIGGWNKGNLVVVGGRPGMGKSALGLNFCVDGSKYAKYLFVSIEMSEDELAERIIADISNIENSRIRNAKIDLSDIERISKLLFNQNEFHVIDTKDNNVYNIISVLKMHRAKYGLDVVVMDYLQKLDAGGRDVRTNVGLASTALKNIARELGITVIALAQLNRDGKNARPELTELKESGQIEQDADVVLFPFRPAYYEEIKPDIEEAVVIIAKNRHGRLCDIPCTFEGGLTRYRENINPL